MLFDWGDTLMRWTDDGSLVEAGHRAGLDALGRRDVPTTEALEALTRERRGLVFVPGVLEEIEYPGHLRAVFGALGIELSDEELGRFLEAEHAAWSPARRLGAHTHALLESLRDRGLRLGLVSNTFDPGWLLRRDLEEMGLAERLDTAVFSSETGWRKPHPGSFERALDALGVAARDALFVGDRLYDDVRGAAELGMTTVQALWFRADEHPDGREPDFQAFTEMDVLNTVRRLGVG